MVSHVLGGLHGRADESHGADEVLVLELLADRVPSPFPALELGQAALDLGILEACHPRKPR